MILLFLFLSFVADFDDNKISILIGYLTEYFGLLRSTEKCIIETKVFKQAELSSITRIFDQIRNEIDSKEKLIKSQFNLLVKYFEEPLFKDLEYLSNKWISLWENLNIIMNTLPNKTSDINQ